MPGARHAALPIGLILIAIGLERLLSAYLIGTQAASWSTRLLIGTLCVAIGSAILALMGYVRHHNR